MSEKFPSSSSEKVPVLVKRSSGEISVMHRTDETDEHGRTWVESQSEEKVGGKVGIAKKPITAEHLSLEYQAQLAEELAMSRNPSQAELDRGGVDKIAVDTSETEASYEVEVQYSTRKDMGELALVASGIASPSEILEQPEAHPDSQENTEQLAAIKHEYDRQVEGVLGIVREDSMATLSRVEQAADESGHALNVASMRAGELSESIQSLSNKIEYNEYTPADVRKLIESMNITGELNSVRNSVLSADNETELIEGSISALHESNGQASELLADRERRLKDDLAEIGGIDQSEHSVDKKQQGIQGIDESMTLLVESMRPLRGKSSEFADDIRGIISNLDITIETIMRHNTVDSNELAGIASRLQVIAANASARTVVSNLNEAIGQVRQKIRALGHEE